MAANRLAGIAGFAPTTFHALGARVAAEQYRKGFHLTITNVPGPQFPLYAAGAQMVESYPVQPLLPDQALAIGVTSYDGGVYYGLTGDRDALPDIGLLGYGLNWLGFRYDYTQQPGAAWFTIVLMDVWHWTSLVVLLAYAGLRSIDDNYYRAAQIDGASAWAVFRYIQLPKMKHVLTIAVLLRFMDSFMIYTEPFVLTGGGPGNATTVLSIDLVKIALGQFDLGPAASMSLIYFLIILLLSWLFYTVMTKDDEA